MSYNVDSANPLVLAWVGDAYFAIRARIFLAVTTDFKTGELHNRCNRFVSAKAQSKQYDILVDMLDEQELQIARRAQNAHLNNVAKNTDIMDYKKATALEAVIGAHVLTDNYSRLDELFEIILKQQKSRK